MKREGTTVCLIAALLLCVAAGPTSAYTVVVCTDGVERPESLDKIYEYSSAGSLLLTYEDPFPESELRWSGMEIDNDGMLYLPSMNYDNVYQWDSSDGSYVTRFTSGGGMNEPMGAGFSPDGSIYYAVSTHYDFGVARYNGVTGEFIDKFITPETYSAGLTVGPNGNLWISTTGGSVQEWSATTGLKIRDFAGGYGNWAGAQKWHDGDLYFKQGGRIIRIDGDGTPLGEFVVSGSMPDGSDVISSFDWGPDGDLYVCASANVYANNYVYRFNGSTGAYIDTFATLPADGRPSGLVFTPEPATVGLLLLGLPFILRRRRS